MRAFAIALCVVFAQAIRLQDTTTAPATGPATGTGGSGEPYPADVMADFFALPLASQQALEAQFPDGPPPVEEARKLIKKAAADAAAAGTATGGSTTGGTATALA